MRSDGKHGGWFMFSGPDPDHRPLRVALVNDYEIVRHGLALMLRSYRDRVVLIDLDSWRPTSAAVDIALIDTDGRAHLEGWDIDHVLDRGNVEKAVIYSWAPPADVESRRLQRASGFLSKGLGAVELVAGLERAHRQPGTVAIRHPGHPPPAAPDWPGRALGLTPREGEMVVLITEGRSNQLIAEQTFLSINSVKSYIRTAYRKMEVTSRSQAVLWGLRHGLGPTSTRVTRGTNVLPLVPSPRPHGSPTTLQRDRETS